MCLLIDCSVIMQEIIENSSNSNNSNYYNGSEYLLSFDYMLGFLLSVFFGQFF